MINVEKFLRFLDNDISGTNHSFYDPFRYEVEPTRENVEGMIEAAMDCEMYESPEFGSELAAWLGQAARYKSLFIDKPDDWNLIVEAVCQEAKRVQDDFNEDKP